MNVYIASPFFNSKQLGFVRRIEQCLDQNEIEYFSPRKHGVISEMINSHEKKEPEVISMEVKMKMIYEKNIEYLNTCDTMICVIDNKDVGTMFELGYFTRLKEELQNTILRIITITNENYGLNVMLRFGTDCHIKKFENLEPLMQHIKNIEKKNIGVKEKIELEEYLYSQYDDPEKVVT